MEVAVGQILAGLVEELAYLGRVPGHLVAVFNNHILLFFPRSPGESWGFTIAQTLCTID